MPSRELTKPCTRPGCAGTIRSRNRKRFPDAKYCSRRCTVKARIAAGWVPGATLDFAIRSRAGKIGALKSAATRHRRSMLRAAEDISALLPAAVAARFDPEQRALVKALIARGWRKGYKVGYRCGYGQRTREAA